MSPLKSVSKKSITPVKYLIIGNSAAGVAAVESIRQYDKTGTLAVVSDEPWHTYSRPLISYLLEGKTTQEKMRYRSDSFYERYAVDTYLGVRAEKLDTKKRTVTLSDGVVLKYEKLLLATGSVPFVPPISGCPAPNTGKGVYTFIKLADALALQETVTASTQVVVIGGGLTGVKATEGLLHLTKNISLVELAPRILPNALDTAASDIVKRRLESAGVTINCDASVSEVLTGADGNVSSVRLSDGRTIPCDVLVISIGVRPNVELTKGTDVAVERGILIDETCQTSVPDVFAAGDCVVSHDLTDDSKRILAILPNAYQQGKTAGAVMAGQDRTDKGARPINATSFIGLPLITAGKTSLTAEQAAEQGITIITDSEGENYRKLVIQNDRLIGFILLGATFTKRAGILTDLLNRQIPLSSIGAFAGTANEMEGGITQATNGSGFWQSRGSATGCGASPTPELLLFDKAERLQRMEGVRSL